MDGFLEGPPPSPWPGILDPARPHSRPGGSRNRPSSIGLPCLARIPSISAGSYADARIGLGGDAPAGSDTLPSSAITRELSMPRSPYNDCLSFIGLPGEEMATFVPLVIEPYDPPASESVASPVDAEPRASSSPTAAPSLQARLSPPSPVVPRPPAGAATQRVGSGRRNIGRQGITTGVAAAPGPTLLSATSDPAGVPASPALSVSDVSVVVFDPNAAAAAAGLDVKSSSAFLDPSKPAVRRLLPPLLRASQASFDAASEAAAAAGEDGAAACGGAAGISRCNSGVNSIITSPSCGNASFFPNAWVQPSEAAAATAGGPADPLPSPLLYDAQDSSPPSARRARRPVDLLRSSAASAASMYDSGEPEPAAASPGARGVGSASESAPRRGQLVNRHPDCGKLGRDLGGAASSYQVDGELSDETGDDDFGADVDTASEGVQLRASSLQALGSSYGGLLSGQTHNDVPRQRGRSFVAADGCDATAAIGRGNNSGGGTAIKGIDRVYGGAPSGVNSPRAAMAAALPPISDRGGSRRQTFTQ